MPNGYILYIVLTTKMYYQRIDIKNNLNYKLIYRLFEGDKNIFQSFNIFDIIIINNSREYNTLHIDYEFHINDEYIFWSHGIVKKKNLI